MRIGAFQQGLQQLRWTNGQNVRIDIHVGAADADRIRRYAEELVALAPDVILATGAAAVAPLLKVTRPHCADRVYERAGGVCIERAGFAFLYRR